MNICVKSQEAHLTEFNFFAIYVNKIQLCKKKLGVSDLMQIGWIADLSTSIK